MTNEVPAASNKKSVPVEAMDAYFARHPEARKSGMQRMANFTNEEGTDLVSAAYGKTKEDTKARLTNQDVSRNKTLTRFLEVRYVPGNSTLTLGSVDESNGMRLPVWPLTVKSDTVAKAVTDAVARVFSDDKMTQEERQQIEKLRQAVSIAAYSGNGINDAEAAQLVTRAGKIAAKSGRAA